MMRLRGPRQSSGEQVKHTASLSSAGGPGSSPLSALPSSKICEPRGRPRCYGA